jgi:DNA adenine methylase
MRQALTSSQLSASPFLKWAGGKKQLLDELESHIPRFQTYYEPFLGGGALFFYLASSKPAFKAHLSDLNADLVNAFQIVKHDVGGLVGRLRQHESSYYADEKVFYYRLRAQLPDSKLDRAARIVALNKTCYNGLYRVNRGGNFNVPIGRYKHPSICNVAQLRNASDALNRTRASITVSTYSRALSKAAEGDFVYLDPPFVPLSSTSNFVSYTENGFSNEDQVELASLYKSLDERGCKVLLSNSDTRLASKLYSDFDQFRIKASRAISCKGDGRTGYSELLVRNYTP